MPSRLVEVELWEELTFVSGLQVEDIFANVSFFYVVR
jgi:hypothetical protein